MERIGTFAWTYDSATAKYLDIHRRISRDNGASWSAPEPLGFSDQAARPAIFSDGATVLAWVDRFGSKSIRARLAQRLDAPFNAATEVDDLYPSAARYGQRRHRRDARQHGAVEFRVAVRRGAAGWRSADRLLRRHC